MKENEKGKIDQKQKELGKFNQSSNTIPKWKSTTVKYEEENKMSYNISSWIPIVIKSLTFMKNIFPWLNGIIATRALEVFTRKESQTILSNGCVIDDCSRRSGTK